MAWSHKKRLAFEKSFYEFLDNCIINSKDYIQPIRLGEHLYWGQKYFYDQVFDGLEQGIHKFYVLKSRQLGISTSTRALSTFYIGVHRGLQGALVFDTLPNRNQARNELVSMISMIPPSLGFPAIRGRGAGNRDEMTLVNGSQIQFKNAGVRRSKTSGGLGRSVGLAMAHLSEICMYDNEEGLESFEHSLSEVNPDRLYIWESTARGFNIWFDKWNEARDDPTHCKCLFLGWWSKDSQKIARSDPDFERYGTAPPTDQEMKKIARVRELYDFQISQEQLAWIRRKMDPAQLEVENAEDVEGDPLRIQEQPWTEDEAFQQTGAVFFTPQVLTDLTNKYVSNKYTKYIFQGGAEFTDLRIFKAPTLRSTELKVWEEPHAQGVYVLGVDPAYGENELNDRSSIQVLRCFADGVDQVAEYAWPMTNTRQLAWVIAALMAWYGYGDQASVRYILELNGPGTAVFNELRSIKQKVETGYFEVDPNKTGLENVFRNVRTYIYTRPDGMGVGQNYHWKTNINLKVMILERMRDFCANGSLKIRSISLIDEMNRIKREGDSIGAPAGQKDDRVFAMALACHCWEEREMKTMINDKRTRAGEEARLARTIYNQVQLMNQNQLQDFFKQKEQLRFNQRLAEARAIPWGTRRW